MKDSFFCQKPFRLILSGLLIFPFIFFSCAGGGGARNMTPEYSEPISFFDDAQMDMSYRAGNVMRERGSMNDERMITYTASLELSVKDIEQTRQIIHDHIKMYNGFITRESLYNITARIPADKMDEYLGNIKELGKVENESKTGSDITDQYRDNVIRLTSLKNVQERYMGLLERAETVIDILNIERELERVNTEIEILEGRINYSVQSVLYSNITIRFRERAKPGPVGWIFYGLYHGIKWLFVWD